MTTMWITSPHDPPDIWQSHSTYTGQLAFDVGANSGMTTQMYAANFDRVVAFEPCRESYRQLVEICPSNCVPVPFALGSHPGMIQLEETEVLAQFGELKFGDQPLLPWGQTSGYRSVPRVTLDQMSEVFGFPDFVKIDTEGSEVEIVAGGRRTFEHCPEFLIEIHTRENGKTIRGWLATVYGEQVEVVRHSGYPLDPDGLWANHYYVRSRQG